jgi:hypothetical protein
MAKKNDAVAQRARRQKIFVAVGGVVLIALLAIQGPKVLKQLNGSGAAAPAETAEIPASSAVAPSSSGSTTPAPVASRSSAVLVGVPVTASGSPEAEEGQLSSFSRFEAKDPFEPNVSAEEAAPASAKAPSSSYGPRAQTKQGPAATPDTAADTATDTSASAVGGVVAPAAPAGTSATSQPVTNATIAVNGKSQQLVVKDHFPKPEKTFVLVGLTDGAAKVGVAGGSFTDGATVALKIGKQVTLVDTATGARYVLKLLYLGSAPEQVASFSAKSPDE